MASVVTQEQAHKNHTDSFETQRYQNFMSQELPMSEGLHQDTSNSDIIHGSFSATRLSSPRIVSETSHLHTEREGDPLSEHTRDKQLSRRTSLAVTSINHLLHSEPPTRADEPRPIITLRIPVLCLHCNEVVVTHNADGSTTDLREEHQKKCRFKQIAVRDASPPEVKPASIGDIPATTADSSMPKDTNTDFHLHKVKHDESERMALLEKDSQSEAVEEYRVLCAFCEKWIQLRTDRLYCPIAWTAHKLQCVYPPCKLEQKPEPATKPVNSMALLGDIPEAPPGVQVRRTEEERIKFLEADPNATAVEPHRVLCAICRRWIQLRKNSTYCTAPWVMHVKKCIAKHQNFRRGRFAAPYVPDQTPSVPYQDGEDEVEFEEEAAPQTEALQEERAPKRGRGRPPKRKPAPSKGVQSSPFALRPISGPFSAPSSAPRGNGRSLSPPRLRTPSPVPNHPYSSDMYWYPSLPPLSSYYSLYAGSQYNNNDDSYSMYFHAQPPANNAGSTAGQSRVRAKPNKSRNAKTAGTSGVSHRPSPKPHPSDSTHASPGPEGSNSRHAWIVWRLKDYSNNSCPMDPSPATDTHSSSMLRAGSENSGSSSEPLPMYRSGTWPHLLDPQEPSQTQNLSPYVHPDSAGSSKDTPIAPGTHSAQFPHTSARSPQEDPGVLSFNSSAHIPIRASESHRPPPPQSPLLPRPQVAPDLNIDPRFAADPLPSKPPIPTRSSETYRPPPLPHQSPLPLRPPVASDSNTNTRFSVELHPAHTSPISIRDEAYRPPPPQSPLPPRSQVGADANIDPRFSAGSHAIQPPIPVSANEIYRPPPLPQAPLPPRPQVAPDPNIDPRFSTDPRPAHTPKLPEPPKGKDLDSPEHRLAYTFQSIAYLFKTSYQGADDMSLDTLTTFMNRCIPPEKIYDGREVSGHVAILGERKQLIFTKEGGVQLTMSPPP